LGVIHQRLQQLSKFTRQLRGGEMVSQSTSCVLSPEGTLHTYLHAATLWLTIVIFRLFAIGKESVVLNVAYDSGALRIYDKVGFVGLLEQEKPGGVEDMLELGFVGADRGHW
jgi:hypothetical protein